MSTDRDAVAVRDGARGRGVFATRDIGAGEVVESCPLITVGEDDAGPGLDDYVIAAARPGWVHVMCGYGMLYNHSARANLNAVYADDDTIEMVAARPIAAREELTLDYGPAWWETRRRKPIDPEAADGAADSAQGRASRRGSGRDKGRRPRQRTTPSAEPPAATSPDPS